MGIGIFDNLLQINLVLDSVVGFNDVELENNASEQRLIYETLLQQIFPLHVESTHILKKERLQLKFIIVDDVIQELSQIAFKISSRKELALLRLEDGISPELLQILHVLEDMAQ